MSLSVTAPKGSHFGMEEVKTDRGTKSLGDVPILVWDELDGATEHYGEGGICQILDGTSLKVSFQSIGRRMKIAFMQLKDGEPEDANDKIAQAQIDFKPGKRGVGASTPVSRAKKAAGQAAEKLGEQGDIVAAFLAKVAAGEVDAETLASLTE